ncbi:hypothetical protein [Streptomyces sp. NPDC020681]|uniref:hypothetical protein n=1 Tax=Streptomyces sp. NPDC020681 TaxID=3365083 RepID=UPI0037B604D6
MGTWRDARARATDASEAVRAALASIGLPESAWSGVRPMVTASGRPLVHLGALPAAAVEVIAEALMPGGAWPRPDDDRVEWRWLDTGSGPGAMVPVLITETTAPR